MLFRSEDFAINLAEIPEPTLREFDVLVDVHAVGSNPGETFIRSPSDHLPVALGFEIRRLWMCLAPGGVSFWTIDLVGMTGTRK